MTHRPPIFNLIDRRTILNRLPEKGRWYSIQNATDDDRAVIRIFEEIGYWGITEEDFARDLERITASEIEVQISSPGGDAHAGVAIYNQLRAHPARIITRVDGLAASAASVIVQAGDHRQIMSAAQMMIHDAWGLCVGPAADMREMADVLDKMSDSIAGIYAARSGGEVTRFRDLMATDTYLTDTEALELGLVDEIYEPPSTAAGAAARMRSSILATNRSQPPQSSTTSPQGQEETPMDLTALREAYNLDDDMSDDDVIAHVATQAPTEDPPSANDDGPDPATVVAPAPAPESVAASDTVTVSAKQWQDTQDQLTSLAARDADRTNAEQKAHRDQVVASAVATGRISPAERDTWREKLDESPDTVEQLLSSLAARVPLAEIGHAGDVDTADSRYAQLTADAPSYKS